MGKKSMRWVLRMKGDKDVEYKTLYEAQNEGGRILSRNRTRGVIIDKKNNRWCKVTPYPINRPMWYVMSLYEQCSEMDIRFDATKKDYEIIAKIADRAERLFHVVNRQNLMMDLDAAHSNGSPLDFRRLLEFPDFDFMHDISGISKHINRKSGELENCFSPRCSL